MRRLREDRGDEGISLVEVLVAFSILIITLVPLTYILTSTVSAAANSRQREAALQLADSWVEILSNSTPPTDANGAVHTSTAQTPVAPAGAITPNNHLAGTIYTVSAKYSLQSTNQSGQSDLCTDEEPPSPSHPGVIQLQVTVSWDHLEQSLTDTTNINYPKPGLQTEGFLAIQVTSSAADDALGNDTAARLVTIPITVSGGALPSPLTLEPDSNGCVFAQLMPGTYSVKLGQPATSGPLGLANYTGTPPFVDPSGNSAPNPLSETVQVTNETTASLTFDEGVGTSISYGGAASITGGVSCPGTSALTCVSLGNGRTKAVTAWGADGSTWSSKGVNGASTLSQVGCTTGSTPTCVAVGETASGGATTGSILTTSSDFSSVQTDTVPAGVTDVTAVNCPSANGCYALGTSAAGPVLLAGAVGQTSPLVDTWVAIAPPSAAFASLSSLECLPSTTTCMVGESSSVGGGAVTPGILRLDGDPSAVASNSTWTPTFNLETSPPGLVAIENLACPTSTLCIADAVGDTTSPSDPTILTASIASSGPDNWDNESTFPTGTKAVTGLSCTSNDCVAIGVSAAGGPAVWTGDLTASPHDWAQAATGYPGIPTSVTGVTGVACGVPSGSDSADCVVTAATNSPSNPSMLLEGTLNGSWAWNPITPPTSSPVLYYTGVACVAPAGTNSNCAAAGNTAQGPVIVTASTPNAGSWDLETPSSMPSARVAGIPLETSPASLSSWATQVTQAQATPNNATTLPTVLYPLSTGYSIVAGDCAAEVNPLSTASLTAPPGGTASVTIPLGLLPIKLVNPSTGAPVSGATVVVTSTQCSPDKYTVPITDPLGLSATSLPYGSYSYSVNGTAVGSITVGANSVSVTAGAYSATTVLPGPVAVPS
jgi:Tfp pilus assembly protein PilV